MIYPQKVKHFFVISFRYGGEYHPDGRQFIVVCGNINYESVQVKYTYFSLHQF